MVVETAFIMGFLLAVYLPQVVIKIEAFNYSIFLFLLVVLSGFMMLILTFIAFHSVNLELACFK